MRRKLFFITIVVITVFALLDCFGIELKEAKFEELIDIEKNYQGKVVLVEKKGEKYNLEVSLKGESKGKVLISYYGEIQEPFDLWNCTIEFKGKLQKPQGRRNPGCFNYEKHLRSEGVFAVSTISAFNIIEQPQNILEIVECKLITKKIKYLESLSEESQGFIAGILFGDTSFLDEETYQEFKNNGTAHVLAVSGLHIGILYGMLKKIFGKRQSGIFIGAVFITLILFGTLAMWSPSVTRASATIAISTFGQYKDKRYDLLTAMSVVMICLVVYNPYIIFNIGFQMSFLAGASIAFFMPHIPTKIPDFLAVMIAVNIGLLPYQIFQFNYIPLMSFVANIPIVFLLGTLMPITVMNFMLCSIGFPLPPLEYLQEALSAMLIRINSLSSLGGEASLDVVGPPLWILVFFYLVIFFLASETHTILKARQRPKKIAIIVLGFMVLSIGVKITTFESVSKADIVFVDVGQGDCIHIKGRKRDVLIDGGGSINYNLGMKTLKPYLLKNGTRDIDLAIATHKHTDHYKGLEELMSEEMIKQLKTDLTIGKTFSVSENIKIETLWPIKIIEGQDENSNCSVFMINYKKHKILITGDLDSEGEAQMLEYYKGTDKLKADILKIGHHGSKSSTSDEFLDVVDPEACVIQVGKNNYGHPNAKVIEKCIKKDIMLFRNDINGAVGISFTKAGPAYYTMINDKGN